MDLKELQRLLAKEKGRLVIVENGKPIMVITPYGDYGQEGEDEPSEEPFEGIEEASPEPESLAYPSQELTIDDLPL